jgi:hypothetical protein
MSLRSNPHCIAFHAKSLLRLWQRARRVGGLALNVSFMSLRSKLEAFSKASETAAEILILSVPKGKDLS